MQRDLRPGEVVHRDHELVDLGIARRDPGQGRRELERVPEIVIEPDGREVDGAPVLLDAYWQTTNGKTPAAAGVGAEERS